MNAKTDILKSVMMATTSLHSGISMTPTEQRLGRLLRAPDHGASDGGDGGSSDGGQDGGSDQANAGGDKANDGGDDSSLLGDAGKGDADAGAGDKDSDGGDGSSSADADQGADGGAKDGEGDDDKDGDDDSDQSVPETYELKLEVDGEDGQKTDVPIDTKLVEDVTPVLKELKLTNDQANKLAAFVPQIQGRVLQAQADAHAEMRADWAKQAKEDKEIGGAKFEETMSLAARALDRFGAKSEIKEIDGKKVETNEFRGLLNQTGFGDHPVFLKMFREIGKLVGEDGELIHSDAKPVKQQDRLEVLYPDDVPAKQGS